MNNRQLKKRYKKLYDFDFIKNKIKEAFPDDTFNNIEVAFYDVKYHNIGIILDNRDHGYYDIKEDSIIF